MWVKQTRAAQAAKGVVLGVAGGGAGGSPVKAAPQGVEDSVASLCI